MWILGAALAAAALAEPLTLASAEHCAAYRKDVFCSGPGVVWCRSGTLLASEELARNAAPILWFSPDEPLLPRPREGWERRITVPQELRVVDPRHDRPSDAQGDGLATVYWRVTGILTKRAGHAEVDRHLADGKLFVPGIQTLRLEYFFYYDRDEGLNPHYNDVEGIELHVDFDEEEESPERARRYRAAVARVTGHAHGSELLANILQIKKTVRHRAGAPDVMFPITILVEEGKHASVPDRNGDGTYTPGYDVNIKPSDAWGVRDVFGSGVVASHYRESMAKPRRPPDRVGPKALFQAGRPVEAPAQCYATNGGLYLPEQSFSLEAAPECKDREPAVSFCEAVRALSGELPKADRDKPFYAAECLGSQVETLQAAKEKTRKPADCNFLNMARSQKAFSKWDKTQFRFKYLYGPYWPLQPFRFLAPAIRTEGTAVGPQVTGFLPFGPPKFPGWFAGRAALVRDADEWHWRTDVSLTPSITRLADWYVAAGYDWGLVDRSNESSGKTEPDRVGKWVTEAGLQVRFRAVWLRAGTRFWLSGGRFSNARFVSELGFGPQPKYARVH